MPRQRSPITSCAACNEKIVDKKTITCKNSNCNKVFQLQCLPPLTSEQKVAWTCPEYQCATKKGGDNSLTPIRAQMQDNTVYKPISLASQVTINSPNSEMSELTTEFRLLRDELCSLKTQLADATTKLTLNHERIDTLSTKINEFDVRLKAVEDRMPDLTAMQDIIIQLQERVDLQAQNTLMNELEIIGIPENPNENLHHVVLTMATKIGIELQANELDHVSRVGAIRSDFSAEKRPRPIAVRFLGRVKRNEFHKNARTRRNLNTQDLTMGGTPQKVYVNERLTREKRLLFRDARLRGSEAGFKYCWTRNCAILIRKREGSGAHLIRSQADLDRILGSAV